MKLWGGYFFLWGLFTTLAVAVDRVPNVVTIPLQNGEQLEFCAIYLGIDGKQLLAAREVTIGCRNQDEAPDAKLREELIQCMLSGSFVGQNEGEPDWCYYLGTTEVTQGQWAAIMGGDVTDPKLPKTELTFGEVQLFVDKLNQWVLANQRGQLPTFGKALGYFRLPSEVEWEFAARGGLEGHKLGVFDRLHPYQRDIARHEWSFETTDGKLKPVAKLGANPVGIHDMLGNAAELVGGTYGFVYMQARQGAHVIRGGKAIDYKKEFRASRRSEAMMWEDNGTPLRDRRVGFRLAIGSAAMAENDDQLWESWKNFVKNTPPSTPIAQQQDNLTHHFEQALEGARSTIAELETELESQKGQFAAKTEQQTKTLKQSNQDLRSKVTLLSNQMAVLDLKVRQARQQEAWAWVQVASVSSSAVHNSSVKIRALEPLGAKYANQVEVQKLNFADAWSLYQTSLKSLGTMDANTVQDKIDDWAGKLDEMGVRQQRQLLAVVRLHTVKAAQGQRLSQSRVLKEFQQAVQ